MGHFPENIDYSDKYYDDYYEYRHVQLPQEIYKKIAKNKLLTEIEWRTVGIQQSRGWEHYEIHKPEPFIILFRRPLGTDPQTGCPPKNWRQPKENIYQYDNLYNFN